MSGLPQASDDIDQVVATIEDVVALGAQQMTVCGWSFGAAMCIAAATHLLGNVGWGPRHGGALRLAKVVR